MNKNNYSIINNSWNIICCIIGILGQIILFLSKYLFHYVKHLDGSDLDVQIRNFLYSLIPYAIPFLGCAFIIFIVNLTKKISIKNSNCILKIIFCLILETIFTLLCIYLCDTIISLFSILTITAFFIYIIWAFLR